MLRLWMKQRSNSFSKTWQVAFGLLESLVVCRRKHLRSLQRSIEVMFLSLSVGWPIPPWRFLRGCRKCLALR